MAKEDISYPAQIATLQNEVLEFLRAFESIQENLRPGMLGENQARNARNWFPAFESSSVGSLDRPRAPLSLMAGMIRVEA